MIKVSQTSRLIILEGPLADSLAFIKRNSKRAKGSAERGGSTKGANNRSITLRRGVLSSGHFNHLTTLTNRISLLFLPTTTIYVPFYLIGSILLIIIFILINNLSEPLNYYIKPSRLLLSLIFCGLFSFSKKYLSLFNLVLIDYYLYSPYIFNSNNFTLLGNSSYKRFTYPALD